MATARNVQGAYRMRLNTIEYHIRDLDRLMRAFPDVPLSPACEEDIRKLHERLDRLSTDQQRRAA